MKCKSPKSALFVGLLVIAGLIFQFRDPVDCKGKLLAAWIREYDSFIQARAELRFQIQTQTAQVEALTAQLWEKKSHLARLHSSLATMDTIIEKIETAKAAKKKRHRACGVM